MANSKVTRAEKAGIDLGNVIVEMVHLMYQNNTARNFYKGLTQELNKELSRRSGPILKNS